jgi:hypothetical protein
MCLYICYLCTISAVRVEPRVLGATLIFLTLAHTCLTHFTTLAWQDDSTGAWLHGPGAGAGLAAMDDGVSLGSSQPLQGNDLLQGGDLLEKALFMTAP